MIDIASPLAGKPLAGEQVKLSQLRTELLHIRGKAAAQILNADSLAIGSTVEITDGLLVRLRRDEFVLLSADVRAANEHVTRQIGELHVTVTDITHGRGSITLGGHRALDVLAKVCALDFADSKFPNHHAAQTSLAKVRTLIIRDDMRETPAYHIIVDRSLVAYVWDVVADAATHR